MRPRQAILKRGAAPRVRARAVARVSRRGAFAFNPPTTTGRLCPGHDAGDFVSQAPHAVAPVKCVR